LRSDAYALRSLLFCRPKIFVLDLQDDHFTKNTRSLRQVRGEKSRKIERIKKMLSGFSWKPILILSIMRLLDRMALKYLTRSADLVITSSYTLGDLVKKYNRNSVCIPDSIDYQPGQNKAGKGLVWIGTAYNIKYLLQINKSLKYIQSIRECPIKIITDLKVREDEICKSILQQFEFDYELVEWSVNTYADEMKKAAIGIAPLPSGIAKSTNKILAYMACGLPVVCSGCADYEMLLKENPGSFVYIKDESEWAPSLLKLLDDAPFYQRMSQRSIDLANSHSLSRIASKYVEVLSAIRMKHV
jgi:glycosyltransferase involved in cell wall biosynthesis